MIAVIRDWICTKGGLWRDLWRPYRKKGISIQASLIGLLLADHVAGHRRPCYKMCCLSKEYEYLTSPGQAITPICALWPFMQWRMDIFDPLLLALGQCKFPLVAIDYFKRWVEAEPLTCITESKVMDFMWRAIIHRFSILRMLIIDNGR